MDSSLYKDHVVPRGYKYHYYFTPGRKNKPTLLFLHGFPAFSYTWKAQIKYFQEAGFGVVAPDLLGAGESSHPQDAAAFIMNGMASDVISILDAEGIHEVLGVSHDWGSALLSRLVVLHPERFLAYVWLCVPYDVPDCNPFDLAALNRAFKELLGFEQWAYWEYFNKDSATSEILANVDSFMELVYPNDPLYWRNYMVVPGKAEEWITTGRRAERPTYLTADQFEHIVKTFAATKASALGWYRCQISNLNLENNRGIPKENWALTKPALYIGASKDFATTYVIGKIAMEGATGPDITIEEMDGGHWLQMERPEDVNKSIHRWLTKHNLQGVLE